MILYWVSPPVQRLRKITWLWAVGTVEIIIMKIFREDTVLETSESETHREMGTAWNWLIHAEVTPRTSENWGKNIRVRFIALHISMGKKCAKTCQVFRKIGDTHRLTVHQGTASCSIRTENSAEHTVPLNSQDKKSQNCKSIYEIEKINLLSA